MQNLNSKPNNKEDMQYDFKVSDTPKQSIEGMTVFNTSVVDVKKQPMFFGQPLGVQRFDVAKYPVFEKLKEQQNGFFCHLKRYPYKKTGGIIKHFLHTKSISILLTSNTRLCLTPYKVVLLGWLLCLTVHYLNLKVV